MASLRGDVLKQLPAIPASGEVWHIGLLHGSLSAPG